MIRRWLSRHPVLLLMVSSVVAVGIVVVGVWRFMAGRPMVGEQHRTDCTFLRPGTRSLVEHVRWPSAWSLLPGWRRAAWRVGVLAVVVVAWWGWVCYPRWTAAVGVVVVVSVSWWWISRVRDVRYARAFRREWVTPLALALSPVLDRDPDRYDPWLRVDPELGELSARVADRMSPAERQVRAWYAARLAPMVTWLPDRAMRLRWWVLGLSLVASLRTSVTRPASARPVCVEVRGSAWVPDEARAVASTIVGAKLGMSGGLTASWSMTGPEVVGRWEVSVRPPESARLEDVRAAIDACESHEFVLGLGIGSRVVTVSLDDDSPHIACSAGSGAGKSVLAKAVGVQVLRRGGRVFILDRKGSHRWARGLPGVTYLTKPGDMHAALVALADEADQRNEQAMVENEGWRPADRVLIIFEEMNATFSMLRSWWAKNRDKDAQKISPAVEAFQNIMYMGRSAQIHLFAVAQMLTARTTGGPEARENFGIRMLARYTRNAWMMLCPEAPMPRPVKVRGRWQCVVAGEATPTQVVFLSDDEARELVIGVRPVSPDGPSAIPGVVVGDPVSDPAGLQDGVPGAGKPGDGQRVHAGTGTRGYPDLGYRRTLAEWCTMGIVPVAYNTAKAARRRDSEAGAFPVQDDNLYSLQEIQEWVSGKPAWSRDVNAE